MTLYKNLGNSRREGLFLYGYLEYTDKETAPPSVYVPLNCPTISTYAMR